MGHDLRNNSWFKLAHELAETGRYRNVAEVETALKAGEPDARLPADKVARGVIDATCYRARRQKGWEHLTSAFHPSLAVGAYNSGIDNVCFHKAHPVTLKERENTD